MRNGFRIVYFVAARRWDPSLIKYPLLRFEEVVERETTRRVDIWADGHTGIGRSRDMLELAGTLMPDQLEDEHPRPTEALVEVEISREQFETSWRNAVKRVEWEMNTTVRPSLHWYPRFDIWHNAR